MVKDELDLFISTLSWITLFGRHGTSWYQIPGAPYRIPRRWCVICPGLKPRCAAILSRYCQCCLRECLSCRLVLVDCIMLQRIAGTPPSTHTAVIIGGMENGHWPFKEWILMLKEQIITQRQHPLEPMLWTWGMQVSLNSLYYSL